MQNRGERIVFWPPNTNIYDLEIKPNTNTNLFGPKMKTEYESVWSKDKNWIYIWSKIKQKNKNFPHLKKFYTHMATL